MGLMAVPDYLVRTITIDDTGVSLEYVAPAADIKANGVQLNHVVFIPREDDYDDEIGGLEDAALYLLRDVLEDLPNLPSAARKKRDEEEDED